MLLSKFEAENPFFKRYLSECLHVVVVTCCHVNSTRVFFESFLSFELQFTDGNCPSSKSFTPHMIPPRSCLTCICNKWMAVFCGLYAYRS